MKITIDTVAKTVTLNEPSKLADVNEFMLEHFPKTWTEYMINMASESRPNWANTFRQGSVPLNVPNIGIWDNPSIGGVWQTPYSGSINATATYGPNTTTTVSVDEGLCKTKTSV